MKTISATYTITPTLEDQMAQILVDEIRKEMDNEILISMLANWPKTAHDNFGTIKLPYGWAGEHSIPNKTNFQDHMDLYKDIIKWIRTNIQNPEQNALWNKIGDCIYVMIRKPKDYTMYALRFGHE